MDQERVVGKVRSPFEITGKAFMKMLYLIGKTWHDKRVWNREHPELRKKFMGEQQWFDLISSNADKNIQTFMNSEVNFDKVNEQFKDLGIVFATKDNRDGSREVEWLSRDDKLAEKAIQKALKQIVDDPKKFMTSIQKNPKQLKPIEQIKYFKKINNTQLSQLKETIGKTKPKARSK